MYINGTSKLNSVGGEGGEGGGYPYKYYSPKYSVALAKVASCYRKLRNLACQPAQSQDVDKLRTRKVWHLFAEAKTTTVVAASNPFKSILSGGGVHDMKGNLAGPPRSITMAGPEISLLG